MNEMLNCAYFNSNGGKSYLAWGTTDDITCLTTIDFQLLDDFIARNKGKFIYGYISYDAKNSIEELQSTNKDGINAPTLHFCVPEVAIELTAGDLTFLTEDKNSDRAIAQHLLAKLQTPTEQRLPAFKSRITKQEYLESVRALQQHIQQGDIYEINFCQEYFLENTEIEEPKNLYANINELTKAPFSVYLQHQHLHVLSGSPERYIQRKGSKLLSQPIKGTSPRGRNKEEDEALRIQLRNNPKEIAENVMIVDLVRNDLSHIAQKGSVRVDEIFGIYTFPTVHQMISTISCHAKENVSFSDILKATFPMGSMTGAPKISAMQLSEKFEQFKRGIYSGTIGYILPNGDFDFNVVIRSLIHNAKTQYTSCAVGGAITIKSEADKEFEECEVKIRKILNHITT